MQEILSREIRLVLLMDKNKLNQYKSLQKEVPLIQKKLNKLYERRSNIQEVKGKVKASSKEFPYIETHVTVRMNEPKEYAKISKLIDINEGRLENVEEDMQRVAVF